ncbi:xanthine dehydrogenase small subunit [Anderseniella sp. Alg231-50]|uniref:xanthine dehydrogenase small subunit n=1 Tax=Anderseniella sp. Alg231-50 TaxID=1922226 RepID=UPI000D55EE61
MAQVRNSIRFLLNDRQVDLDTVAAPDTLLDFLRLEQRLCGSKEGCAEGDCGACTVLVGRLADGDLKYETVNACIRFVGSLDACHVVTIEHLRGVDGALHPVQQAMVDMHGSQCGFCTPGIVMSLYALWMANTTPSNADIETALQGNLCRCTGYEAIIRAAVAAASAGGQAQDVLVSERDKVVETLQGLADGARVEMEQGDDRFFVPASVADLAVLRAEHPASTIVAGATDVGLWVTKFMRGITPAIFISHLDELHRIEQTDTGLTIGACVTYTEFQDAVAKHFPQIAGYWNRIGGEQVRNMGTVGGNVANGSPIGDTPPVLIGLGASVTLRKGIEQRTVPVEDFFIDYGKQDRQEGDFVEALHIPFPGEDCSFAAYKVSKRRDEDISSVAAAFHIRIADGKVAEAVIAYGGMAATPKRAKTVESLLTGKPWSAETIAEAEAGFADDFTPIGDWRASAEYRTLVARKLLTRFLLETTQGANETMLRREAVA